MQILLIFQIIISSHKTWKITFVIYGRKIIKKEENKLKYPLHDSTSIIEVKLATISNKEMSPRT